MKKDNENISEHDDEEKLDISKSVFQSAREFQEQRKAELERQQIEMRKQIEMNKRQQQEDYDRKIREERIELIRLKLSTKNNRRK